MAVPALVELNEQTQLPFGYALTVFLTMLTLIESVVMIVRAFTIGSGHRWARLGLFEIPDARVGPALESGHQHLAGGGQLLISNTP
ncbi:hypothetical protein [Microlunatus sp. GCM10028923]|uniref:hypothetical protein n=1 Tax=Microlunatus sp. GCM10028923 TaxID=3273400 RepID=UPI003612B910